MNFSFSTQSAVFCSRIAIVFAIFSLQVFVCMSSNMMAQEYPKLGEQMTDAQVERFARLALDGMDIEYPNKPSNVMVDAESVRTPREMHPAFYGCFDWHSSIHGHWMLVRLLKEYPECSIAEEVRAKLAQHLTQENLEKEAEYFRARHNRSFERMYGWAWAFRLVAELETWDDEQGNQWRENMRPLEEIIVQRTNDYLPKLAYPIRTGVHPDSAFALGQALDYARIVKNESLEKLIVERATHYYSNDKNYNSEYEPSGEDFFSASLNEADLMRRILSPSEFESWLGEFLPNLVAGESNLLVPVEVSDVTDGKIVHLAGLDLSRAWCFLGIASSLDDDSELGQRLRKSAEEHAQMGFKYVFSGHYEGEHWLATFAVYGLTEVAAK